eukprot:771269-Pelagomonas_calceolata.AAC.2
MGGCQVRGWMSGAYLDAHSVAACGVDVCIGAVLPDVQALQATVAGRLQAGQAKQRSHKAQEALAALPWGPAHLST